MYKKSSFGSTEAQAKLASLIGQFEFPASGDIAEVNDILEKAIFALNLHGAAPKFVLKRALYDTGDQHTLQTANFVVSPAAGYKLAVAELKKNFMIVAGEDFFNKFVKEMAVFFDEYQYHKQLQDNVDDLNAIVADLIAENEIPYSLKFSLGDGILDATDDSAVLGLSAEVIEDLGDLPLFDEEIESRSEGYKSRILETLKSVSKPFEIVKVKTPIVKDLDIYNRRLLHKLIRKFVSRKSEFQRVGVGYVEGDDWFAVVEKDAVTVAELDSLDVSNAVVVENEGLTKKEKEEGKTKVVVTFKISPFNKETGAPVDISIAQAVS